MLSACLVLTLCQQVPEYFKRGLNCIDACNLFLASKTEDRIRARLEEIAAKGMPFAPYSDDQIDSVFHALCQVVHPMAALKRLVSGSFCCFLLSHFYLLPHCTCSAEVYRVFQFQLRGTGLSQRNLPLGTQAYQPARTAHVCHPKTRRAGNQELGGSRGFRL